MPDDDQDWTATEATPPPQSPLNLQLAAISAGDWTAVEPELTDSLPLDQRHRSDIERVFAAQSLFLSALRRTGSVFVARTVSGVHLSALKAWRADDAFRAAEAQAIQETGELVTARAVQLAVEGVDEPVFQGGVCVGHKKKYDSKVLVELLRGFAPERFAPKTKAGVTNNTVIMSDPATIADAVRRLSPTRRKGEVIEVESHSSHKPQQPLDTQTEHQR